jgi:hypothetical protein
MSDMAIYRQSSGGFLSVIWPMLCSGPIIGFMRRLFLVLVIAALVVLVWAAWGYGREFLAVDSCLDSSGSFDYAIMTCDHTENHPYISYGQRHPTVPSIAALAGVVAVCSLVGVFFSRPQNQQ